MSQFSQVNQRQGTRPMSNQQFTHISASDMAFTARFQIDSSDFSPKKITYGRTCEPSGAFISDMNIRIVAVNVKR